MKCQILALAAALLSPVRIHAQTPLASTPVPKPCAAPEHRQFDFWVGSWSVQNPKGQPAGSNEIQSILGGCVLLESWSGAGGSNGKSFNQYNPLTKKWHQTWVDDGGRLLLLDGAFADGKMVLEGTRTERDGGTARHRVTWQRIEGNPDRVRQLWESSRDDGKTWKIVFDGLYVRKK